MSRGGFPIFDIFNNFSIESIIFLSSHGDPRKEQKREKKTFSSLMLASLLFRFPYCAQLRIHKNNLKHKKRKQFVRFQCFTRRSVLFFPKRFSFILLYFCAVYATEPFHMLNPRDDEV